jgi:pimeloyl-ACP methyl ester carboxylesterase
MRILSYSRLMAGIVATQKFRTKMRCASESINRGGLPGDSMMLQRAAGMAALSRQLINWSFLLVLTPYVLTTHAGGQARMQRVPPNTSVQEGVVRLADSNIEYFSQGQGESIVLLPFGGLTVGYMQELSQDLADAGYRVVRINFRGSGKSTGSGEGITLHTLAADVAGVIGVLKLGKVNIAGHAFGNRVARTLAADHPELVRSVILFAAGGKVPPDPSGEHALQAIFNPASTDEDILRQMKYMVGDASEIPMAWQAIKPCRAPQAAGIQRTAMQNTPLKDWWAPPGEAKYLILQGTNDQIAPPENGALLKQELGERATLVSFPGAGHLFIVTEPNKGAAAVVFFLGQTRT